MENQPGKPFETRPPVDTSKPPDATAPDGSQIRLLPTLAGGGMAHCLLHAGATSMAVTHRTVAEIWYVTAGAGEVWRKQGDREETVAVAPGTTLTIPLG